jgi:hypothetical protein
MTVVAVPAARLERWVHNFGTRHGDTVLTVQEGAFLGAAPDGSQFEAVLPFSVRYDGAATAGCFADACVPPSDWGILLVRKGGFAVARLAADQVVASKVGQRHVQGRTAAGGQSQQRFARRRDNQARAAYEAAAEHAVRLIADVAVVVVGGDSAAVAAVLDDARLGALSERVVGSFLAVADPRRAVLEAACAEAQSASVTVQNA